MKNPLRLLVLAVVALVGALVLTSCGGSSSVTTVGAQDFLAQTAEPGVVVVDVRTASEFAQVHLEGVDLLTDGRRGDAQFLRRLRQAPAARHDTKNDDRPQRKCHATLLQIRSAPSRQFPRHRRSRSGSCRPTPGGSDC